MYQMLRDKLLDAYLSSIPFIVLNVIWFICSLPIVTLIPSTAALFYATNQLAHRKPADWHTFFEGFRRYFWQSWLWGVLNGIAAAGLISNELFYTRTDSEGFVWLRGAIIALTIFWLGIQMYSFPLLLEQEHPHLRLALRNSLVILIKKPIFTVSRVFLIGLLMVASTVLMWPVWIFLTASVCTFLANQATLKAIGQITGNTKQINHRDTEYTES